MLADAVAIIGTMVSTQDSYFDMSLTEGMYKGSCVWGGRPLDVQYQYTKSYSPSCVILYRFLLRSFTLMMGSGVAGWRCRSLLTTTMVRSDQYLPIIIISVLLIRI